MKDTNTQPSLAELADFALAVAQSVTPLALRYFRNPLDVELKADHAPVTVADRQIESEIRATIAATYPDHGIFGEEHGQDKADSAELWIIDPIDGTKSFISGMPTFGALVAYVRDGVPVIGVISAPATGEIWLGVQGQQSRFGDAPCQTRACKDLADARLYTTSPDVFDAAGLEAFERLSARAGMRRFGGDCYSYGLLASGHVDAVVEMSLQPYDFMALVPVIEGAGGQITDWQGAPLSLASSGQVVAAATPALHAQILELING